MRTNYRGGRLRVELLERCRQLRTQHTDAERLLWSLLRNRQVGGAKSGRQHQFGPYILDFYWPEYRLAIEADGGQHLSACGSARDEVRARYLGREGIRVLRFSNLESLQETEGVLEAIWQALGEPSP